MIPLSLGVRADAEVPFVTRLRAAGDAPGAADSIRLFEEGKETGFAGPYGFFTLIPDGQDLDGDVVLVDPARGAVQRLIRASSRHNTLLITEQCDQLCVMCSQPPKKTHVDRFAHYNAACLLAPHGATIGISGGEPTLYKEQLFSLIEQVFAARPDLTFHVLSNGQHFELADADRLRGPAFKRVTWGIPLYSAHAGLHDQLVGKAGAFERLERSFHALLLAGANIELRTVVMQQSVRGLSDLAQHLVARLSFIASWSIMQLEHIGFARNRWSELYFDHSEEFAPIASALDLAGLHAIDARLFNFPLCTVPPNYRHLAPASISDWKTKFPDVCAACSERQTCAGFFAWHPPQLMERVRPL